LRQMNKGETDFVDITKMNLIRSFVNVKVL